MASELNNVGLVKTTPFLFPANKRSAEFNPSIIRALEEFHFNTPRVFRAEGLSNPIANVTTVSTEDMCRRALATVLKLLEERPAIQAHQAALTIVDGTGFPDSVATDWGADICYVNVFWNGSKNPVIAVVMGRRKRVRTYTHYHLEDKTHRHAVVFEYDMRSNGYGSIAKMRKEIINSTNFHQLQEYGTVIRKALAETTHENQEYPVAAAVYHNDVVWYMDRPNRHPHIVHSKEFHDAKGESHGADVVQGFLTNHGNFVTRYRAMYMAMKWRTVASDLPMQAVVTGSAMKEYKPIEKGMGGILQPEDLEIGNGYRIIMTPLFSEDLW